MSTISRGRALVCTRCGGIMGTHLPWCKRSRIVALTAGLLLAVLTLSILAALVSLASPASASTAHHPRQPWYCTASDWGNIRTEPSGKSYICQPAGKRYAWRIIHEYIEN